MISTIQVVDKSNLLRNVHKNVVTALDWSDEAMPFTAAEGFYGAKNERISHCTIRPGRNKKSSSIK
jgi:hypothetical protein